MFTSADAPGLRVEGVGAGAEILDHPERCPLICEQYETAWRA